MRNVKIGVAIENGYFGVDGQNVFEKRITRKNSSQNNVAGVAVFVLNRYQVLNDHFNSVARYKFA